ncbi:MAG: HAMP domain-containing sensor histidine kinase [Eubacteriales bacterium]|nr:HAMP domain-containing sensor histidine kinase [Eubacteriales bacterium]
MKKLKIFPKTFLYTLGLMLIIVLLSHGLIYFLMPKAYHHQKQKALETDIFLLEQEITDAAPEDRLSAVTSFAAGWKANISVYYEGLTYEVNLLGEESDTFDAPGSKKDTIVRFSKDDHGSKISLAENTTGGADFFRVSQKFSDGKGHVQAVVSRQQIEEAVSAVLAILPLTAAICTIISALFAFFYSRMLTRPICQISSATEKMQRLEPEARCMNETQDEIGVLADNVNGLYHNLLTTIHELEQEIRKVEEADVQKTNFLRAASHELKTPVTAVNAILENMILGVGRYKDRDTYLARCKKLMEGLADMIRDILDTTRTEFSGGQELIEVDLADTLKGVAEPYEIIAKTKGIKFDMQLEEPFVVQLPRGMIEKALSNIVANAVSYTREGGIISVYLGEGRIIIENECAVISPDHLSHIFEPFYRTDYGRSRVTGGNGLGLYIVSSILKSLSIKYKFVPSEVLNGMSFQILF